MSDYDVIVMGGGAPGEHCAAALAARGLRAAVVERELVGGECSYWACIPSKSLLRPGEAVAGAREVGASAGCRSEGVWGTREATSMKAVRRCLLVLGGGSAGVELAQVVRRLGGEVVLVEGTDRVLPREPAPLGAALGEAMRRDGIELMLGMQATAAQREGDEYVRQFDGRTDLRGDRLLMATGRPPRVEGIGLETVGVQAAAPTGSRLTSTCARAIGDVNGIWPLTHVGEYEGDVVAANIAGDARTCCGGTAWSRGGLRVRAGGGTR